MSYSSITSAAGWTCTNCKAWVGQNMPHSCTWTIVPAPHPLPDQTDRLISAIERLIAAINKGPR